MITFVINVTVIVGLIIVFGLSVQRTYKRQALETKLAQVQSQCNILASQILLNEFKIASSTDNLSIEINQLANVYEGRILVVDSNYRIIKDTYTIEQNKYMISENVHDVMRGKVSANNYMMEDGIHAEVLVPIMETAGSNITTPTFDQEKQSQNAEPVKGVIICIVSIRDQLDTIAVVDKRAKIFYTVFIFIAILVAVVMSFFVRRPFLILKRQLHELSEGHFDEPLEVRGTTEVRDIVENLNQIMSKIQIQEASRQEFVSNVSHELKTPITSMKVLADSLLSQEDVPAEMYREFMTDLSGEIDRENKIITDLLTLVRLNKKSVELNIETISINELLEVLLKRVHPIAEKNGIELFFESMREVTAEVDEVKLSLAFNNLIVNAVKYNVENGWVRVSLDADHKFFYVKVADSGVGIPEESQERVFERFYRVDKSHSTEISGTGLGLAITRNAILAHKGAINLYSKPGEGTTFTVRIPLMYLS